MRQEGRSNGRVVTIRGSRDLVPPGHPGGCRVPSKVKAAAPCPPLPHTGPGHQASSLPSLTGGQSGPDQRQQPLGREMQVWVVEGRWAHHIRAKGSGARVAKEIEGIWSVYDYIIFLVFIYFEHLSI